MPYLIDGNNLAHSLPGNASDRSEVRRLALQRVRSSQGRLTLVFDGPPPEGTPRRESLGSVTVIYASPRSADEVILAALPEPQRAREWIVVTNDRELAARARRSGAQTQHIAQFLTRCRASRPVVDEQRALTPSEIAQWEEFFATPGEESDNG